MSTNSECHFYQIKNEQWFYVLEDDCFDDEECWNWLDNATAYGPFVTENDAQKHLEKHHSNPGGSHTFPLTDGVNEFDFSNNHQLAELIKAATSPSN
jgi:hypothetical protein